MWEPPLGPKQREAYRNAKRFNLMSGPRMCGKTWVLEHLVLKHAWRHQARFAIICKTTRQGSLGIWPELTTTIYDVWKEAGVCSAEADFGWTKPPTTDPTTKIRHARLRNRFGGESEILLFPVERAEDAKDKLFSTQFSAIWISEAHLYESRELYDVAKQQLRLAGVSPSDTRIYCDCNPPDEGTSHWLYDVFFRERHLNLEEDEQAKLWDEKTKAAFIDQQKDTEVYEFSLDDNTFLDPKLAAQVRATYARSPDDFKRFVLGEWLDRSSPSSVFRGVWDRNLHLVGDTSAPNEADWQVMVPASGPHTATSGRKTELLGGWDLGNSNHAWVALQPWFDIHGRPCFDVLDELLILRGKVTIEEVTKRIQARMREIESAAGFPVNWVHFSDSSAMQFRAATFRGDALPSDDELTDAGLVSAASKGEIDLIGSAAVKKEAWQQRRVWLLSQLLAENRLRVSAHCFGVIEMFEKLRRDNGEKAKTFLAPGQDVKHLFDALSYPIAMKMVDTLTSPPTPRTASRMISSR